MEAIRNRYEFVVYFDVENGNPNGDPDAGNMPRTDPETSFGIVTDVCIKRKIRNYVDVVMESKEGYKILINPDKSLNEKFAGAYKTLGCETGKKGKKPDDVAKARDFICQNYYDVRTFGAVMSTGDDPCGIVRGPVQINFARSVDRVFPQEITITRQARTTADRAEMGGTTEIGKKNIVPYALYRMEGYVSAMLAQKTGFSDEDMELLCKAIENMFEYDRSSSRGKMCVRKLVVFRHSDALGNCPAHILLEKVQAYKKDDVEFPRSFGDYIVTVDRELPEGTEIYKEI